MNEPVDISKPRTGLVIWLVVSQLLALGSLVIWLVMAGLSVMAFDSGVGGLDQRDAPCDNRFDLPLRQPIPIIRPGHPDTIPVRCIYGDNPSGIGFRSVGRPS